MKIMDPRKSQIGRLYPHRRVGDCSTMVAAKHVKVWEVVCCLMQMDSVLVGLESGMDNRRQLRI